MWNLSQRSNDFGNTKHASDPKNVLVPPQPNPPVSVQFPVLVLGTYVRSLAALWTTFAVEPHPTNLIALLMLEKNLSSAYNGTDKKLY